MDSNNESTVRDRSLVVKLRYTPLCTKCVDVVSRWCLRPPHRWWTDDHSDMSMPRRSLLALPSGDNSYPKWTWTIPALKAGAPKCRFCSFLWKVLEASPWMHYDDNDILVLRSYLVGSQHVTPYQRAYVDWKREIWYDDDPDEAEHLPATEYTRFYRPGLQVYRKTEVSSLSSTHREDVEYTPGPRTFILPAAQISSTSSEAIHGPDAFFGRRIGCKANIPLIQSWLRQCESVHGEKVVHHGARCSSDKFEERSTDVNGCRPRSPTRIACFRLVDVNKRCIVEVDEPPEFAALSYVWGGANRLLLDKNTVNWLSTPGSLSDDEPDIPRTFMDAITVTKYLGITHIWIDALCIMQDDADQVRQHMDVMEGIYGSATLTIVSDTPNVNTGIPGVSYSRGPPQASFQWAGTTYLSARRTFGEALRNSSWEKRAWCLQEKIFSKRLLVFTEYQAFYHCASATWFEDTIMEQKENISGAVHLREQWKPTRKLQPRGPNYSAYEAHREFFGRNFWSLVKVYSKRELSYPSDTIRAFAGILNSVTPEVGCPVWGVPSYEFARGLTWVPKRHRMDLRKSEFPSWSWAGWQWSAETELLFANCKRSDADLRVSEGRYRTAPDKQEDMSVWNIQWYYHRSDGDGSEYRLTQVETRGSEARQVVVPAVSNKSALRSGTAADHLAPIKKSMIRRLAKHVVSPHTWHISGRPRVTTSQQLPGERSIAEQTTPPLQAVKTASTPPEPELRVIPALKHISMIMPPLSHIIRFYTSVATVSISCEQDPWRRTKYKVYITGTETSIASVQLDPTWPGLGAPHKLVYISRWCPDVGERWEHYRPGKSVLPEYLNVLLVEDVPGWGEIKSRVQLVEFVKLQDWQKAEPRWEWVSLA